MERIRVDPDALKAKSKEFVTSAGVFARAGKEILAVAAGLPSYDGQLSGPARAAALEMDRQCQEVSDGYINISQSLVRTAQAFKQVDDKTICALDRSTSNIAAASQDSDRTDVYTYTWWDDVNKAWVTKETIIIRHPFGDPDIFNRTTIESLVTNPDGSVTKKKIIITEKVITDTDRDEFYKRQNDTGSDAGGWATLLTTPLPGFIGTIAGIYLYFVNKFGFETPPFNTGDTLITKTEESETTYPDGSKSSVTKVTVEIIDNGILKSKTIEEETKSTTPDGNSDEIDTVTSESYYPKDEGGGIKSRDVTKVETSKINGVDTITTNHSETNYNPDGSVKDEQIDPPKSYTTLE